MHVLRGGAETAAPHHDMDVHRTTLTVLAACAAGTPGLSQAPLLSPRHDLAGDSLVGPAAGDQSTQEIAAGGPGALVVWADRRAQLFHASTSKETGLDIWAVRLGPDGVPLDTTPRCLGFLPGDDVNPRVTWGGSSWLVTWSSRAPLGSSHASGIVGVRVAPDGSILDPAPITILSMPFVEVPRHSAASDGQQWTIVAGESTSSLPGIVGVRVASTGQVLDPNPVVLFPSQWVGAVDIAEAQGVLLVTYSEYFSATGDDVRGRRFGANLAPLGGAFSIGATSFSDGPASVASSGAGFFVAFGRSLSGTFQADVRGVRVSTAGAVLDASPLVLCGNRPYGALAPDVAWSGSHWVSTYAYDGIELSRVTAGGVPLDPDGFQLHPGQPTTRTAPRVAASPGGSVQVVWTDSRAGSYEGLDVYGARVVDPANQGAEMLLSRGAPAQVSADLASAGAIQAVALRSEVSGVGRIVVARLDSAGLPLDTEPLVATTDPRAIDPTIASDGNVFLVAWTGISGAATVPDTLYMRRLSTAGVWLDASPVAFGPGTNPSVAGAGGTFLVAYIRATASWPIQQFPTAAVVRGSDGQVLAGPTYVSTSTGYTVQVDTCATPGGFVVAWQRNYSVSDTHSDVNAAFVSAAGAPMAPFVVGGSFNTYHGDVSVATSGSEVLFVWRSGNSSNLTRRLEARRTTMSGAFMDASPVRVLGSAIHEHFAPVVTFDGSQYVAVFQDLRDRASAVDEESDVYGVRILPTGVVRDPVGFLIERTSVPEVAPCVVGLGGARALFASSVLCPESALAAYRVATRTFEGDCAPPSSYCTAKLNSLGRSPAAHATGEASVGANSLVVTLSDAMPNAPAILVYGGVPAAVPAFGGFFCVGPTIQRGGLIVLDASGAGGLSVPVTPLDLGQQRCFQWWSRDAAHPDGTGVSLSDGVRLVVCP